MRWGNDGSDAYVVIAVVVPACSENLWGSVSLIPVEKKIASANQQTMLIHETKKTFVELTPPAPLKNSSIFIEIF
jgi:hypothetical protein